MKYLIVIILCIIAMPSFAQDAQQRQLSALPHVIEQRNVAYDGIALCQGDTDYLQAQIANLNKQLADTKAELDKLKTPPPEENK